MQLCVLLPECRMRYCRLCEANFEVYSTIFDQTEVILGRQERYYSRSQVQYREQRICPEELQTLQCYQFQGKSDAQTLSCRYESSDSHFGCFGIFLAPAS